MHHATPNKIFTQLIPLYFLASFHNKKNDIPHTSRALSASVVVYRFRLPPFINICILSWVGTVQYF